MIQDERGNEMRLREFKPHHDFLVCVDSDGCAVDTMDIKHKTCFGPCMIEEWKLEDHKKAILERWDEINLYTMTRGINRFKGLAKALEEINDRYGTIDGVEILKQWTENAGELSEASLEREIAGHDAPVLKKALNWSKAVNKKIEQLPWSGRNAFPGVKEAFERIRPYADIAVVSSANRGAVEEEWKRFGLLDLVDLTLCQDDGTKAYCIAELKKKGYAADHILMIGDAPGDEDAAEVNGVLYYPILVRQEADSWNLFVNEPYSRFLNGTYSGTFQEQQKNRFHANLGV